MEHSTQLYVGFWKRLLAMLIDTVLLMLLIVPLLYLLYGGWDISTTPSGPQAGLDLLISGVLPAIVIVLLWKFTQATPGKMALGAKIVDVNSGAPASTGQLIGRYFAYILSLIHI